MLPVEKPNVNTFIGSSGEKKNECESAHKGEIHQQNSIVFPQPVGAERSGEGGSDTVRIKKESE